MSGLSRARVTDVPFRVLAARHGLEVLGPALVIGATLLLVLSERLAIGRRPA